MIAAVSAALILAQTTGSPPPAPRVSGEAEALFQQGLKAYDERDFARAIASFEAAHRLSPMPEILFDIGMSHRALGDCRQAARSFDAVIAAVPPGDPLLPRARDRRAALASCLASAEASEAAPATAAPGSLPQAPAPPVAGAALPVPAVARPAPLLEPVQVAKATPGPRLSRWRDACIVSAGGAGVLATTGLLLGWRARVAEEQAEHAERWDEAARRADERGRTFGEIATGLLASAGVTALLSATTCVLARARD